MSRFVLEMIQKNDSWKWAGSRLIVLGMGLMALLGLTQVQIIRAAPGATFVVNSIDDSDDGNCNDDHCSLREAIDATNNAAGADIITFSVPANTTITVQDSQWSNIIDDLTVDGTTAVNLTLSGSGYHIFAIEHGPAVTITTLTMVNGGGAIYSEGMLNVTNCKFSNNSYDYGGAIFAGYGAVTTIENSTFDDNFTSGYGGAIYNIFGALTIGNSTFSNNATGRGGGIYNISGSTTVYNSTFSNNTGYFAGGGIFNGATGTVTTINSTFSDNFSNDSGGGIMNDGTLHFSNTIFANSTGGGDCVNNGTIGTNTNNLVEDGSCNPMLSGDPLLGPLQDNGSSTWTHALLSGSPAVDAGHAGTCAAAPVNNLDQRGMTRPYDGDGDGTPVCDIGAYEQSLPPSWKIYLPLTYAPV